MERRGGKGRSGGDSGEEIMMEIEWRRREQQEKVIELQQREG